MDYRLTLILNIFMGQKVHPLGFRVGITKNHQSQWFARFQKYGYSQSVVEDHMLRKTILNLFSNLETENKLTNKTKKSGATDNTKLSKITQIKIERGLIPYEIGIQIHSDDCLAITKAIDNIKISKDLVSNLQKTRKYLFKASTLLKANLNNSTFLLNGKEESLENVNKTGAEEKLTLKKRKFKITTQNTEKKTTVKNKRFKFKQKAKKKLSFLLKMRLKNLKRRLKKRQSIKKRYLNIISKGLLLRKKGNVIIRNVKIKRKNKKTYLNKSVRRMTNTRTVKAANSLLEQTKNKSITKNFKVYSYQKFAGLFLTKLNKQFLIRLKAIMKYWHNQKLTQSPLGYNKKWYKTKSYALINTLKAKYLAKSTQNIYQVEKLTKLISILEKKSLIKMETLRKDFITFGTLSKTRAFGYYQMITFLKELKVLVLKIKKQTKYLGSLQDSDTLTNTNKGQDTITENNFSSFSNVMNKNKTRVQNLIKLKSKLKKSITQKVVNNFVNLADKNQAMPYESRKIKWISYLKDLVNKHRTENIFYYLATIADARKDLKALKRYTKQHSNFLFGINLENGKENPNALLQRVTKTLTQQLTNTESDTISSEGLTGLQKAFLKRIASQRKMYKANLALTPKISIKFFSVKRTDILEKASIVADSIVDALEKRKAFRGVIKKAKEDLMRRPRVKGVKIQVAGRLNGAEIARSEWVRAGRVPLQTLRANIDYSYRTANTIYGIIGVKVWIFKGYTNM